MKELLKKVRVITALALIFCCAANSFAQTAVENSEVAEEAGITLISDEEGIVAADAPEAEEEKTAEPADFADAAAEAGQSLLKQSSSFFEWIKSWATWSNLFKVLGIVAICLLIWGIYKIITHFVKKIPEQKVSVQTSHLILKFLKYGLYIIIIIYVLGQFGVKLSAIWGAAGITGVAIGFAAQTALSNIISGVFVLTEKSIKVGDTIVVGDVTGVVDAVNLLSVQVHTLDNQMVRIPNSTVINSNLVNNTYHQQRRLTVDISIAYDTDMQKALDTLLTAPALCPHVLQTPAPAAWYSGFGDSGINLTLAVWFRPSELGLVKNETFIAMKKVFDDAGIEIPFAQLDVNFPDKNGKFEALMSKKA